MFAGSSDPDPALAQGRDNHPGSVALWICTGWLVPHIPLLRVVARRSRHHAASDLLLASRIIIIMESMPDCSLAALYGCAGKAFVVTGGTKGLGLMIAYGLVQNGARVHVCSRKPDEAVAAQLTKMGPGKAISYACNVENEEDIKRVRDEIAKAEPDGIHCLVNNSGKAWGAGFDTTPKISFDHLSALSTHCFSTLQAPGQSHAARTSSTPHHKPVGASQHAPACGGLHRCSLPQARWLFPPSLVEGSTGAAFHKRAGCPHLRFWFRLHRRGLPQARWLSPPPLVVPAAPARYSTSALAVTPSACSAPAQLSRSEWMGW